MTPLENALWVVGGAAFVAAYVWFTRPRTDELLRRSVGPAVPQPPSPDTPRMPLEAQIAALAEAGLRLNDGVTIDDLLHSFPREEYEIGPWHCLLFMYGVEIEREPWGRYIGPGWNFDMECINGRGSYVAIVQEFARLSGVAVTDLSDTVDMDAPTGEVRYTIGGVAKTVPVEINNDWADPAAVTMIISDFEEAGDGRSFWGADNGQATVVYYLTDDVAARVNALTGGLLVRYQHVRTT